MRINAGGLPILRQQYKQLSHLILSCKVLTKHPKYSVQIEKKTMINAAVCRCSETQTRPSTVNKLVNIETQPQNKP